MNKSDHLFEGLLHHSAKNFGKILDTKEKDSPPTTAVIGLILSLAAAITFLGHTAIKVIFRKTPVISGLNLVLIILCFGAFCTIGGFSFSLLSQSSKLGSPISFLITGILYESLALFILIKGIKYMIKRPATETESILTALNNDGWSQKKIRNFGEPMMVFLIGLFYSFFNMLGGLPLVLCAVSVWLHLIKDFILGTNTLPDKVNSMNMNIVSQDDFHTIHSDS